HPRFDTHLARLRTVPVVPVIMGPTLPRRDHSEENWCRAMLVLFKPWRKIDDLKKPGETWLAAYTSYEFPVHLAKVVKNIHVELECKDARDQHADAYREG
ncbi:hypothetical protein PENSPDRAFT_547626, partial [Peniophora sp. CONT]